MTPPESDLPRLIAFNAPKSHKPDEPWGVYPPEHEPERPAVSDNVVCGCGCFVVGVLLVLAWWLYQWTENS